MSLALPHESRKRPGWLVAIAVATLALVTIAGTSLRPSETASAAGTAIYDSTVSPLPGNLPSLGAEAYAFTELGDAIAFAGTDRALDTVTVTMSSWACQSGAWYSSDCVTAPGATFTLPITFNIYGAGDPTPGALIATLTQTFDIPYRPSTDSANCTGGRWYRAATSTCFNGLAHNITFNFSSLNLVLPNAVVYGIVYNTTSHGPSPIGASAACFTSSGGCPYDSLNVALAPAVTVGSKPFPDTIYQNTSYAGFYCDGGAAGTFRLDSPTSACWAGYVPAVQFTARQPFTLKMSAGRADPPDYRILGNSTVAQAKWTNKVSQSGKFSALLEKTGPTSDYVYAGLTVKGAEGWTVAQLGTIGFAVKGDCGGGAPRFNLYYHDPETNTDGVAFYGCGNHVVSANGDWTTMAANALTPDSCYAYSPNIGGCTLTAASTVVQLSVIVDETGTFYIDDVTVAGIVLGEPSGN